MRWQFYAAVTLIAWGLWGYLPKRALAALDPRSALVLEAVGSMLVGLTVLATRGFRIHVDPPAMAAAVVTGACGLGGAFFFLLAIERSQKASVIVALTSLYPLITLALLVLLHGERPSPANLLGILFAVIAVVLLSI